MVGLVSKSTFSLTASLCFVAIFSFRCIMDGKYQQAMGTAIECRRLDKLEEAIIKSDNIQGTLSYCIYVSHSFVNLREYRQEVRALNLLVLFKSHVMDAFGKFFIILNFSNLSSGLHCIESFFLHSCNHL